MINKKFSRSFIGILFLLSALAVSACGGGGDSCDCKNGLICENDQCVCNSDDCCISNEDCDAGLTCNLDTNKCGTNVDGDTDEEVDNTVDGDTDFENDGDVDEEIEQSEDDDDYIVDGDTEDDTVDEEVDNPVDGDTDDEIDTSKTCRFGVDKLTDLRNLPLFENGTTTHQSSSRDPNEGNLDKTTTSLYIVNGNEYVIMHSKVPGCIYRMYFADTDVIHTNTLNFYFNGETSPGLSVSIKEFFGVDSSGQPLADPTNPFIPPFAGAITSLEENVYYSYVPICFTSELLVTVSGPNTLNGWQVTWQDHPDCSNLEDFSLNMDMSDAAETMETTTGENPKAAYTDEQTFSGNVTSLAAGDTVLTPILNRKNVGTPEVITSFKLNVPQASKDILDKLFIDMYWDGKNEDSGANVSVPVSVFFGGGDGSSARNTLMVGYDVNGNFYSYWPMPYWSDAVVTLTNNSDTDLENISYEFIIGKHDMSKSEAGLFHAEYNSAIPTTEGEDFNTLETFGKGHVVGITLAMEPATISKATTQGYLNGDERIFIDGMDFPLVRGTDTRAFFNGDLWKAEYQTPIFSIWNPHNFKYAGTRLMFGDTIPYNRSISMGFEVGGANDDQGDYRSVVYYYHSCLDGMSLTDEIDISDNTSLDEHEYDIKGSQTTDASLKNLEGSFEGEDHNTLTKDSGDGIYTSSFGAGYITAKLELTENNTGVRLVRKQANKWTTNVDIVNQNAKVYVGGENASLSNMSYVGNWYTTGGNTKKIWQESVFDIPARYTAGKSKIKVYIEHDEGDSSLDGSQKDWNIFDLKAYSYLPNSTLTEGPGTVDTDTVSYTSIGLTPCIYWDAPKDGSTPALYHIFRTDESQAFSCVLPTGDFSEYHVGTTTETSFCEPEPLANANTDYYYRILAEDCTAQTGTCSTRFTVRTGIEDICFEAENLGEYYSEFGSTPTYESEPEVYSELTDSSYSDGKALYFRSYSIGQTVVFVYNVEHGGYYDVKVNFVKTPDSGIVLVRDNTGTLMDNIDLYNYENALNELTVYENINYSVAGQKNIQFRVKGKSSLSNNYHIAIDSICLIGRDIDTEK